MTSLIWWVILLALLGSLAGWLFSGTKEGMASGLVVGTVVGVWTALKRVSRLIFPESFAMYASDVSPVVQSAQVETGGDTVLALTIPNLGTRQIRGLVEDEWNRLAHGVVERGYRYTTRDLQDIFGPQEGNRIYGRVTQQLLDAGVLVPSGSNGVAVTDHVGRHFFNQLDKRDYKVIDLIPHPTPESL